MMELLWLVGMAVVVGGAIYVWEKGLLGTATEARIKALRAKAEAEVQRWDQKLEEKIQERLRKVAERLRRSENSPQPIPPPVEVTLVKDKGTRIAENKALLDSGAITQEEFDAAKAKILTE